MKIGDYSRINASYQDQANKTGKYNNVREYSKYLTGKYGCLTPGQNAAVSVTSGLLQKAMGDQKTGAWLERELGKAADYIESAQKSAAARGATLKSVSIEFGEEYTTMTTLTVTDGGGTDSEIDKWLEKVKKKRDKQKADDKKLEQEKTEAEKHQEDFYKMELKGRDLADLSNQFNISLSDYVMKPETRYFDAKA